jgi:hypothetical protein
LGKMGDNINVDWNLAADQAQTTGQMAQSAYTGAMQGYQVGQQQAQVGALQGYDGSPQSATTTAAGLVRANAIQQADALTELSKARQVASLYPKGIALANNQLDQAAIEQANENNASGSGIPTASPAAPAAPAAPSAPAAPAPTPGNFQFNPQGTYDMMRLAHSAVGDLLSTPLVDRPAEAAKVKANMLSRGVPEPAIDAAMTDLSDKGLSSLQDHYGAVVAQMAQSPGVKPAVADDTPSAPGESDVAPAALPKHVDIPQAPPAAGGSTPAAAGPTPYAQASAALAPQAPNAALSHPSNNWYNSENGYLAHPATIAVNKWMAGAGIPGVADLSGVAAELNAPVLNKQADLGYDPAITAAKSAAELPYQRENLPLGDSGRSQLVTGEQAQEALESHPGGYVGPSTQAQAYNSALGSAAGSAPYDFLPIPVNGRPTMMTKTQALVAGGAGMPGFGQGLTPGQEASQRVDADNFQQAVGHAAQANQGLQLAAMNGQKISALADAVATGKYGPQLADLAATFPIGHKAQDYATNSGLLTQDLSASFKDSLNGMQVPKLNSEAGAITSAIPGSQSQPDQIRLYGAGLTAAANYAKRYNDFVVNWSQQHPDQPSLAAVQQAWNAGPGRVSIAADPAYRNLKLSNGAPAVRVSPDGKWGVFMPGTKAAFTFAVQ